MSLIQSYMFKVYKIFMKVWSNIYILTGVVKYMCEEMGFSEDRIRNGLEKMKKAKSKGCQVRNYKVIYFKFLCICYGYCYDVYKKRF